MSQKASWIGLLNNESEWRSEQDMRLWLHSLYGPAAQFEECDLQELADCIARIRGTVDALHFAAVPDLAWLDEKLAATTLTLQYEAHLPPPARDNLPLLHARAASPSGADLISSLIGTVLFQFADFISRLGSGDDSGIARCEGLYRENQETRLSLVRSISAASELRWRGEIDFLKENDLTESGSVQRCADIFMAGPKARFCSDACRFTTFQLVKQMKDPRYHADKQKRYRAKRTGQEKSP